MKNEKPVTGNDRLASVLRYRLPVTGFSFFIASMKTH
jgi:hypothetical protein